MPGVARNVAQTVARRTVTKCSPRAPTLKRIRKSCACTRIRTRDQLIKSQLLYQLSYAGAPAILASLDLGLRRSTTSSNHPLVSSTRSTFVSRLEYLLAGALGVHHDYLEEILEIHVEEFDQCLAQFGARPARARLESRNIVLADAQVVRQFALRQTFLLAHRSQPGRPNFNIHWGIITPSGIFVKTCLQKGLGRPVVLSFPG